MQHDTPHNEVSGTVYRLQIGSFGGSADAVAKCAELKRLQTNCFVLRVGPRA
jgi:hypothetical protein